MTAYQPAAFARFGDVAVRLSVELGRTEMPLRDVLMLGEGSTVTLDRLTDELLDVTANGRVVARSLLLTSRKVAGPGTASQGHGTAGWQPFLGFAAHLPHPY
jgi:flagellar motor switch protein FliN